jgi:site-specific DNA recombinase
VTATRAHIYCRVSSQGQEDGYSLATQETACRTWCAERGLAVASVAHEVWSGGDRHRPELDAMLDRLTSGDVLLSYDLDRLSRGGQVDTAIIIDRIEAAGASVAFVTLDFEKSETGALLRNVRAFAAALEREKIAERTQRGKRARVASGKPIVSPKPAYGYHWNGDKSGYVLDPETAPVVRLIFDWALAGVTLRGIVNRLAERGIPSPTGRPRWAVPPIREVLRRPTYTGTGVAFRMRHERRPTGGYTLRPATADEQVLLPGIAPPIVTPEEQAAVMARLASNQAQAARNNRAPEATLLRAGFVRCGHCGWSMCVSPSSRSSRSLQSQYRCDVRARHTHGCPVPTIGTNDLDSVVWQKVAQVLRDPQVIAREVETLRADGGLDRELAAVERLLVGIAKKQTNLATLAATVDDAEAAAPLVAELKALAERKKVAEAERDTLRRRIADAEVDAAKVRDLAAWCQTVAANLDTLTYGERRLALTALGVQVRVWRLGATGSDGAPLPRWEITMKPAPSSEPIVLRSTHAKFLRCSGTHGSRRRGCRG